MFLAELKAEQRELFLDIGIALSMSDGDFSASEKKMILEMCREMGIAERLEPKSDIKSALKALKGGISAREKRIVLLEAAGIVLTDGEYSSDEVVAMKNIASELEIAYSEVEEVVGILGELLGVYTKIGQFLSKREK